MVLTAQEDSVPPELRTAAESLLAGKTERAIDLAQHYTWNHPNDPRGFLTLGDAYAARMPDGRFRAIENYLRARNLSPRNPEPAYRIAQMGLRLGGDDGERIMRENIERVLALDPDYSAAWDEWLLAYRNTGGRAKMISRLEPFSARPTVRIRIAQLLIESEEYGKAATLLDALLAVDSGNVAALALRAQAAFESADTVSGFHFYARALAGAEADSTGELWQQVIGIATPAEVLSWRKGVAFDRRVAWFEAFWARRNPDLFEGLNHRVAEHFARLRYARTHYPLLHPLVLYQRSDVARALNLEPSTGEREFHLRCELYQAQAPSDGTMFSVPAAGAASPSELARVSGGTYSQLSREELSNLRTSLAVRHLEPRDPFAMVENYFIPLNLDLRSVDTVAARIGYNLATGLDDRGIMYLRFGRPEQMQYGGDNALDPRCNSTEVERWRYPELGEIRFAKPNAFSEGERNVSEMVFRPMNESQFTVMGQGLTRDASSTSAPLGFGVWLAQFRNASDPRRTDLVIVSTKGELATQLVGESGGESAISQSEGGRSTLVESPGTYVGLAHARVADTLGRMEFRATLRSFDSLPRMSDLLLASAWETKTTNRADMIVHVQRDLTFPGDAVVRSYAELYNLPTQSGIARYHVKYQVLKSGEPLRDIARADWPEATVIEFDREVGVEAGQVIVEAVDVNQRQLEPGRYLLRLTVQDLARHSTVGRAAIAFLVR